VLRRLLAWMRQQPSDARARAVSALARAYLTSTLPASARADALIVMTAALDDCAISVRRALAEALASAADAPRHLVAALAADRAEVACAVLAHSPLIDDSGLAEAARHGGLSQQIAIARRARVGTAASWALADSGARGAAIALLGNRGAALAESHYRRIFERFPGDGGVREALVARGGLPAPLRVDLAVASAEALVEFSKSCSWLESGRADRLMRDAREQAIVRIAMDCPPDELQALAEHLRERGFLNVAVLMRALLTGDVSLFETALAVMSGSSSRRVAGFLAESRGRGFAALYAKSGLPEAFLPAFRAALNALRGANFRAADTVSHALAMRAIEACEGLADPRLEPILSLMWRLAGEGARDAAHAEDVVAGAPPEPEIVLAAPEPIEIESPAPELGIEFDPTPALALELELAVAELSETYGFEAPRLDFAASEFPGEPTAESILPPALEFEGANENGDFAFAPELTIGSVSAAA
jgi:uncharacterized protein (DUF2336 family)